jgi:hypothetical protein
MAPSETQHSRGQSHDHGGLIPPDQLFDRVLPGRLIPTLDLPFGERVERAWKRLLAAFEEDEHERLRKVLVKMITAGNR